jgi:hypothetical protein
MKKRLIASLLSIGLGLSAVACQSNDTAQENTNTEIASEQETTEAVTGEEENNADESTEVGDAAGADDTADAGDTAGVEDLGQALYESFLTQNDANPDATATEIAEGLLANDFILFSGATMEVEPGYLTGFGNAEITGFEQGTMFAPMIGSIPFVGYVFTLSDDADEESFVTLLSENADPNWNICTEADETVIESAGNKVFFVMCPTSLDEE